jgi:hypothetical protein
MVNSRFSRQWFCDKNAMKDVSVHGGGAVFARISARLGLRLQGVGMFFGIETVNGRGEAEQSVIDMSSSLIVLIVGDEAVEEDVFIDFRELMALLRSCL